MDHRKFWTDYSAVDRIGKQIEKLVGETARDAVREYMKESALFIESSGKNDITVSVCVFASDLLTKKKFNISKEILDHVDGNPESAVQIVKCLLSLAKRIEQQTKA